MKGSKRGIGLKHALNGLLIIIREERNFKIHLGIAVSVIVIAFILQLTLLEWLIVILTIQVVILMELVNSVLERMLDYIKPDISIEAKMIKDIGAAIVLISAIFSIIVGLIIFLPKIFTI